MESAGFHFESIKSELENNDAIRTVYGNMVPQLKGQKGIKWTNKHFETTNGVNVVARGAGKGRGVNIKNQRPTKVIIDDGETDEQVNSKMRRQKYHDWVSQVVIPSLDPKRGRLKMIGTVIHPHCEVLRFYHEHGGIFRKGVVDGKSVWEEQRPYKDLIALRDGYTDANGQFHAGIGLRAWSQEIMNEPINDDTSVFKREWLDEFTYDRLPSADDMQRWFDIVMAVDPNAGLSEMADFMGICVMGLDRRTNKRYVLHAEQLKDSIDKQVQRIEVLYKKWNPRVIGIEKVLNQTALYQLVLSKGSYPVRALSPEGKDKVNRARIVEPFVEQGVILFSSTHVALYNELVQFPNGEHDDLVDAFLYANELLKSSNDTMKQTRSKMITSGIRKKQF